MIHVNIRYKDKEITVELPKNSRELTAELKKSGIEASPDQLKLRSNASNQYLIGLYTNDPLGDVIIDRLCDNDNLSEVNILCGVLDSATDRDMSVYDSEEIITVPIKATEISTIPTEQIINNINGASFDNSIFAGIAAKLFVELGRTIEEDNRRSCKNIFRADRKLMSIIRRKKEELGIKSDGTEVQYEY